LVAHSSDQCQSLDLVPFGIMKRFMSGGQFRHLSSKQSNKFVKMRGAWHQATSHLVVSALAAMRLIPMSGSDGEPYMCVDRERTTKIRRWNESILNRRTLVRATPREFVSRSTQPLPLIHWFTIRLFDRNHLDG
jgi:hypothetical protein